MIFEILHNQGGGGVVNGNEILRGGGLKSRIFVSLKMWMAPKREGIPCEIEDMLNILLNQDNLNTVAFYFQQRNGSKCKMTNLVWASGPYPYDSNFTF